MYHTCLVWKWNHTCIHQCMCYTYMIRKWNDICLPMYIHTCMIWKWNHACIHQCMYYTYMIWKWNDICIHQCIYYTYDMKMRSYMYHTCIHQCTLWYVITIPYMRGMNIESYVYCVRICKYMYDMKLEHTCNISMYEIHCIC